MALSFPSRCLRCPQKCMLSMETMLTLVISEIKTCGTKESTQRRLKYSHWIRPKPFYRNTFEKFFFSLKNVFEIVSNLKFQPLLCCSPSLASCQWITRHVAFTTWNKFDVFKQWSSWLSKSHIIQQRRWQRKSCCHVHSSSRRTECIKLLQPISLENVQRARDRKKSTIQIDLRVLSISKAICLRS